MLQEENLCQVVVYSFKTSLNSVAMTTYMGCSISGIWRETFTFRYQYKKSNKIASFKLSSHAEQGSVLAFYGP